ncbi:hypothetical protein RYX36_002319 [Vicia faba]
MFLSFSSADIFLLFLFRLCLPLLLSFPLPLIPSFSLLPSPFSYSIPQSCFRVSSKEYRRHDFLYGVSRLWFSGVGSSETGKIHGVLIKKTSLFIFLIWV